MHTPLKKSAGHERPAFRIRDWTQSTVTSRAAVALLPKVSVAPTARCVVNVTSTVDAVEVDELNPLAP